MAFGQQGQTLPRLVGFYLEGEIMTCRIGIATDLKSHRQYWESQHPDMEQWQILGHYYCQEDAQAEEDRLVKQFGYLASPSPIVAEPENPYGAWYVYSFLY